MLQFFLNPWLLAGLIGIGLPVIAHLLSRRRFDVVEWAAMQFLNPARRTRRRLKLEELLLLMLRIGMITLLALAAARPWLPSGMLSGYRSSGSRSVVLVLDGSNSMSRGDGLSTLHQNAVRRAIEFLGTLGPGDSVAVIDARDQPRTLIESPIQDRRVVEEVLRQLPAPAGAANLQAAAERAVSILGRTSSAAREIIVFTDRQRAGWQADNEGAWNRFEDLLTFPSVRPKLWAIDVSSQLTTATDNIAVGRIQLSRDLTVPDFPLRFSAIIRNSGSRPMQVPTRLLLNGQPLAGKQQNVDIPASGEANVEFELTIRPTGTHLLSLEAIATNDPIPADNISHAAVHVTSALPVLLINGVAAVNAVERETFFAALALTSPGNRTPWIQATVIDAADVTADDVHSAAMVILADVNALPTTIPEELVRYASRGNGVFIACGSNSSPDSFETLFVKSGLLPGVQLVRSREAPADAASSVQVAQLSLLPGWLDRFRSDPSRSFLKARYQRWWLTKIITTVAAEPSTDTDSELARPTSIPVVHAQLTTGDPLLIQAPCGDGLVLMMTSSLSRAWNDLPTRSDFVPFLHEAVFQAAASRVRRNVDFGAPLATPFERSVDDLDQTKSIGFRTPAGTLVRASTVAGFRDTQFVLNRTFLPGIYDLVESDAQSFDAPDSFSASARKPAPAADSTTLLDRFVVNYDHSEDDMTPLSDDDRALLRVHDRVRFASSLDDLQKRMYGAESRTELWAILLFLFPCFLMMEVLLTRRMIERGHGGPDFERTEQDQ